MDCEDVFDSGKGVCKYGRQWKRCKCHSAYRWLRENCGDWPEKTRTEQRDLIVANRDHGGRGVARSMHTVHKACIA